MSVATEIQRLQTAKADLKTAIEAKGVTVPSNATIDSYAGYVNQIQTGGGGASGDIGALIDRSITSVTIPTNITTIGLYAFYDCDGITSITIPNNIANIRDYAFFNCNVLATVTMGSGVTTIGSHVFEGCNNLNRLNGNADGEFNFPSGVTSIGAQAFNHLNGIVSVTLGSAVTSIGDFAFSQCYNMTSFTITATTPPTLGTNALSSGNNNLVIYVPAASVNAYKTANGWSSNASRIQAIQ